MTTRNKDRLVANTLHQTYPDTSLIMSVGKRRPQYRVMHKSPTNDKAPQIPKSVRILERLSIRSRYHKHFLPLLSGPISSPSTKQQLPCTATLVVSIHTGNGQI